MSRKELSSSGGGFEYIYEVLYLIEKIYKNIENLLRDAKILLYIYIIIKKFKYNHF